MKLHRHTSTAAVLLVGATLLVSIAYSNATENNEGTPSPSGPNNLLRNGHRRRLRGIDPKSVEPRLPGGPLPIVTADAQGAPMLDTSLIRSVFNGRKEVSKDAIVNMWTMTSQEHKTFAKEAVRRINENGVVGDIVECGVWMGGMTMLMVFANMKKDTTRHFWLFDTFEGLPEPDPEMDGARANGIYADLQAGKRTKKIRYDHITGTMMDGKWNYGPIDIVKNNLQYTGYPAENFHLVTGKVEDTLPVVPLPEKIAILRLDTDWYLSTKAELEYMYDRLQPGGVLIIDDFCAWDGAKKAVVEFFRDTLKLDANQINKDQKKEGMPCLAYWKP